MNYVINNNMTAFEVLFQRHSGKAKGYIYSKVNNLQLSEDILQNSFFKLYKSKDLYKSENSFLPWFFIIIKNTIIDELRKNKNIDLNHFNLVSEKQIESAVTIEEVIKNAPEKYQDLLKLRYIEEKEFEEIAQILNLKETNIRKKISRAIEELKHIYKRKK